MGVKVEKGSDSHVIYAPTIISTAGVYNTFLRLLPEPVASKSYFYEIAKNMRPAGAAMSVFVGLVSCRLIILTIDMQIEIFALFAQLN
jgi:hypothetical protein